MKSPFLLLITFGAVIALCGGCKGYTKTEGPTTFEEYADIGEDEAPKLSGKFGGDPKKDSEIFKDFSKGNVDYIGKLYKEMVKNNPGTSFLVSPLSVQIIFGLISGGAKNNTFKQITDTLHIPTEESKIKIIFQQLSEILQTNDQYTLSSANKIYLANYFKINNSFKKSASEVFRSEVDTINFGQPEEAARMINKWVENKTHDKIHDLISAESLGEDTIAVMINALYFQGTWVKEFEETFKFPFYPNPNKQIDVDMMSISDEFNCYRSRELKAQFLELPYKGGEITMNLVLPHSHSDLSNLEARISEVLVAPKYTVQSVEAIIPKFKIQSTIPFVPILKTLGITDAFSSRANFSGIADGVFISNVIQKTFIEVDEKGTTAAAATGVSFDRISGGGFRFTANHPFLFYLKHKTLGVFFIGRYSGPGEV